MNLNQRINSNLIRIRYHERGITTATILVKATRRIMMKSAMKILLFFSFLSLIYGYIFYKNAYICKNYGIMFNMKQHADIAILWYEGIYSIPHPGYHIVTLLLSKFSGLAIFDAAFIVHLLFTLLTAFLVYKILAQHLKDIYSDIFIILSTASLLTVIAIYVPGWSMTMYLGQGCPNMINSVTLTAVKPFMLLCVIFFLNFMSRKELQKNAILLSIFLLASIFIKPFFALVFIPAWMIILLAKHTRDLKLYIYSFIIIIPSIIALLWQAYTTMVSSGGGYKSGVEIDFLLLWSSVTHSVPFSILLATAFPLAVFLFNPNGCFKNEGLVLSWLMTLSGMVEYATLIETGSLGITYSFNWIWGYNLALFSLFLFSLIVLLRDIKTYSKTALILIIALYLLHVVSGIIYLLKLSNCGSFT